MKDFNMSYKFFLLGLISLFLSGCSAKNVGIFELEPDRKASAFTQIPLRAGDVLEFTAHNMKSTEKLILQKCGNPCNTAKVIVKWLESDFQKSETQWITLPETGDYYFWILKTLENGEVGPVFGKSENNESGVYTVLYLSGTSVSVKFGTPTTK